jgi:hypothetical protein
METYNMRAEDEADSGHRTEREKGIYRVFQKELYNFESV